MDLCWAEVSLLVKLALKVRGCSEGTVAASVCNIFHNMTKGILPNSLFTHRVVINLCEMRTAVLLLVAGLCLLNVTSSLKICAFNIQSFGEAKANNKKVMGILLKVFYCVCTTATATSKQNCTADGFFFFFFLASKILSRCDLCLIQEVRDSKGEAIKALVEDLNRYKHNI